MAASAQSPHSDFLTGMQRGSNALDTANSFKEEPEDEDEYHLKTLGDDAEQQK